jgi:hypothetical protein
MRLLDKRNPKATLRSVLLHAVLCAAGGSVVFFLAGNAQFVQAWKITVPIWMLLCAAVGALWEWQGPC